MNITKSMLGRTGHLDLKTLQTDISKKADKALASEILDGLMSKVDKQKLDGIAEGANNYVHPEKHDASMIETSPEARFTNDEEINNILKKIEELSESGGNGTVTGDVEIQLEILKKQISNLSEKQLEILIYLELINDSNVDTSGYWFDPLTNTNNILSISGLSVDTDRRRIVGEKGEVVFKDITIPFTSGKIKYIHEMDDNFVENVMSTRVEAGSNEIVLDKFSYEIK